jgi:hypothetical protein
VQEGSNVTSVSSGFCLRRPSGDCLVSRWVRLCIKYMFLIVWCLQKSRSIGGRFRLYCHVAIHSCRPFLISCQNSIISAIVLPLFSLKMFSTRWASSTNQLLKSELLLFVAGNFQTGPHLNRNGGTLTFKINVSYLTFEMFRKSGFSTWKRLNFGPGEFRDNHAKILNNLSDLIFFFTKFQNSMQNVKRWNIPCHTWNVKTSPYHRRAIIPFEKLR